MRTVRHFIKQWLFCDWSECVGDLIKNEVTRSLQIVEFTIMPCIFCILKWYILIFRLKKVLSLYKTCVNSLLKSRTFHGFSEVPGDKLRKNEDNMPNQHRGVKMKLAVSAISCSFMKGNGTFFQTQFFRENIGLLTPFNPRWRCPVNGKPTHWVSTSSNLLRSLDPDNSVKDLEKYIDDIFEQRVMRGTNKTLRQTAVPSSKWIKLSTREL